MGASILAFVLVLGAHVRVLALILVPLIFAAFITLKSLRPQVDDDLPIRYRFATRIGDGSAQSYSYLNEFDAQASIGANLAAGPLNETLVVVEAEDSLGAVAAANTPVTVLPFVPAVGASLASVAADLINASSSVGDMQRLGQIVLSLAAALNNDATVSSGGSAEAEQTREVLIDAVVGMGNALTPDAVSRASQTLNAVTARSSELSETATDKSLEFATKLSTEFKGSLSLDDVSNLAASVSSVLASSTRLHDAGSNATVATEPETATAKAENTQARARKLSACVSSLALVVAAGQVAGQDQATFSTETFSMSIKKDDPAQMANTTIGSGNVRVPAGLFPPGTPAVASTVVEWEGAGPLFFAAEQSPVGNDGELRSPVLSVSFSDDTDSLMAVSGLGAPFVLNMSAPNGNQSNESAGCAYWDTASMEWVQDGVLTARYGATTHKSAEFRVFALSLRVRFQTTRSPASLTI